MTKRNRHLIVILSITIILILSNLFVRETTVSEFPIFSFINLFTYFGVLLGFALTVYTFGLSMVTDIKTKIESLVDKSNEDKKKLINKLISGFNEIKQDIWIIFFTIIGVIYFGIANEIENPFGWKIEKYKIPETIALTFFIVSTYSMFDIMKTLFNLAEINLELLRKSQ